MNRSFIRKLLHVYGFLYTECQVSGLVLWRESYRPMFLAEEMILENDMVDNGKQRYEKMKNARKILPYKKDATCLC